MAFRFSYSVVWLACLCLCVMGPDSQLAWGETPQAAKAPAAKKPNPVFAAVEDVPGLPRVLLIGDSISMGYTLDVRQLLAGKANVHRPPTNCGSTEMGVAGLEKWLGTGDWDVIHFNWGLWDINRRVNGQRDVAGKVAATEAEYAERLEQLVQRLKQTNAQLIWASTTYVQGGLGRRTGDEVRYNEIAADIMKKHGVQVNDLHALSATFPRYGSAEAGQPEMFRGVGNVHFTDTGSRVLAEQVAATIQQVFKTEKSRAMKFQGKAANVPGGASSNVPALIGD